MTEQRQTAFRLPTELSDAMQAVKQRDGIPQSEQVRRAIREWLEKRGALKPARPSTRHRHV
jgi:predicted DNA-binding protein